MNRPKDPPATRMVGVKQAAERSAEQGEATAGQISDRSETIAPDLPAADATQQDAPAKPKSASSRQQTQPHQATQTGSAELDQQSSSKSRNGEAEQVRQGKGRR